MATEVSLSSQTRAGLDILKSINQQAAIASKRSASGRKINEAADGPAEFFRAQTLNNRAKDFAVVKNDINQGVQAIKVGLKGLEDIDKILQSMKGIAQQALAASDTTTRATLAAQYDVLRGEIDNLTEDATYNGTGLLKATPDNLVVKLNELTGGGANSFTVTGVAHDVTKINAGGALTAATGAWNVTSAATQVTNINADITEVTASVSTVRTSLAKFGSSLNVLETRGGFADSLISALNEGADKLVLADRDEEVAKLAALNTSQQMSIQSLGLTVQSEQNILALLR